MTVNRVKLLLEMIESAIGKEWKRMTPRRLVAVFAKDVTTYIKQNQDDDEQMRENAVPTSHNRW